MKRVSSRQRLVSWDAFDASAGPSDTSSEEGDEEYTDCFASFGGFGSDVGGSGDLTAAAAAAAAAVSGNGGVGGHQHRKRERCSHRIKKPTTTQNNAVVTRSAAVQTPSSPSPGTALKPAANAAVIPGFSWEVIHPTAVVDDDGVMDVEPLPDLQTLYDDIHLHHVMTFLTVKELGVVSSLNHKFRQLLLSSDAHILWLNHCQQHWKGINVFDNNKTTINTIVDKLHIPTAAGVHQTYQANLRLMLSMTPSQLPTEINKKLLSLSSSSSNRRVQTLTQTTTTTTQNVVLQSYKCKKTGEDLIRYVGPVGNGDRCIRSDHPLPKPTPRCGDDAARINKIHNCFLDPTTPATVTTTMMMNNQNQHQQQYPLQPLFPSFRRSGGGGGGGRGILNLLCRGAARAVAKTCHCSTNETAYRPFVSPYYCVAEDDKSTTIDVTPRLVAYFETSILQQQDDTENDDDDNDNQEQDDEQQHHHPPRRNHRTECTAIGIATKSFHLQSRMPGWDNHSFGYHGDDGGIYHSSGGMVEQFGPTFGPGDTIGCGIDYVAQGIFYTLNGQFLGYAWKSLGRDLLLKHDWYPCVGIDTNSPISVNFGSKPFQYNLTKEFNKKHKMLISPYYQFRLDDNNNGPIMSSSTLDGPSSHSSSSSSGKKTKKKSRNIARRLLSRGDSTDSGSSSRSNHNNLPPFNIVGL